MAKPANHSNNAPFKLPFAVARMRTHGRRLMRLLRHVYHRFMEDECPRNAAALTYMSLFAVVPLMTVVLAMLSLVPAFGDATDQLRSLVFAHFIPASGQEIQKYLVDFSDQARKLTGIGIAFLLVTALTMLTNIEKTFNAIWRTRGHRTGLSSFLRYWAILSLGPLCMGLALGISTYLVSQQWFEGVDLLGVRKLLLGLAPLFLTGIAFTLLFAAIPNCRVPLRDAAIGGAVCAACFEIAKHLFAQVMANASYQVVYGTFAAIPLFLLWIYISWLIVLAGAELVHALSGYEERDELPDTIAALAILEILWRNHQRGVALRERDLLGRRRLLERYTLSAERWPGIRAKLLDAALLKIDHNGAFILGRDLQRYSLAELCACFEQLPATAVTPIPAHAHWIDYYQQLFADLHAQNRARLQLPLAELFAEPAARNEPPIQNANPS